MGTSVTVLSQGGSALGLRGLGVHAQTTLNTYVRHLPSCHLSQNIPKTRLLRAVVGRTCNPSTWEVAGIQGHLRYSKFKSSLGTQAKLKVTLTNIEAGAHRQPLD